MKTKNQSIIRKFAALYTIITIFNVTVFNIIIWENQTELIINNASLESQYKGAGIKYIVDNILNYTEKLTETTIENIVNESHSIGINGIKIFDEHGVELTNGVGASNYEKRMINSAITKQSFENRIFAHTLNEKERTIDLFIPFTFDTDKKGVIFTLLTLHSIDEQMKYLYAQCVLISVITIGIHLLFAFLVTKIFVVPLKKFFPVIQDISKGNFKSRVPLHGTDELAQLAASFNEMCSEITQMQDEAKGANPLTGLPGNNIISQTIEKNLIDDIKFAVLYCDLDNFKAYNDKYGFTKGDDVILYSKQQLLTAAEHPDVHDIFVGHEGGDDFVVITPYDCWEAYAQYFISIFDEGIPDFYNVTDAKQRYIQSVNRQGVAERFPLIGISVAGVNNVEREFEHFGEMVSAAAGLKKVAKSKEGSSYVMDQRAK